MILDLGMSLQGAYDIVLWQCLQSGAALALQLGDVLMSAYIVESAPCAAW